MIPEPTARQRRQAYQRFQELTTMPGVKTIDTETAGLTGPAFELAVIPLHAPEGAVSLLCRVPDETEWSPRALEIHAARLNEIRHAPPAGAVHDQVADLLSGHLIAFGGPFDAAAIERTWHLTVKVECVLELYAVIVGNWSTSRGVWKAITLTEACIREGVPVPATGTHRASVDGELLRQLVLAVAARAARRSRGGGPAGHP